MHTRRHLESGDRDINQRDEHRANDAGEGRGGGLCVETRAPRRILQSRRISKLRLRCPFLVPRSLLASLTFACAIRVGDGGVCDPHARVVPAGVMRARARVMINKAAA